MPILSTVLGTAMLGTSDTPGVDDRVLPAMTIRNLVNLGNPTPRRLQEELWPTHGDCYEQEVRL